MNALVCRAFPVEQGLVEVEERLAQVNQELPVSGFHTPQDRNSG